jgi:hypothetical protein
LAFGRSGAERSFQFLIVVRLGRQVSDTLGLERNFILLCRRRPVEALGRDLPASRPGLHRNRRPGRVEALDAAREPRLSFRNIKQAESARPPPCRQPAPRRQGLKVLQVALTSGDNRVTDIGRLTG